MENKDRLQRIVNGTLVILTISSALSQKEVGASPSDPPVPEPKGYCRPFGNNNSCWVDPEPGWFEIEDQNGRKILGEPSRQDEVV